MKHWWMLGLLALAMVACKREGAPAPAAPAAPGAATAATTPARAPGPVQLKRGAGTTPDYMVGISYQVQAGKYPGLDAELRKYADNARADLVEAAKARQQPGGQTSAPDGLSLGFTGLMGTPTVVAVAADGSSYTGGAHGSPLIARFVWLPEQGRLLRASDLIADAQGWSAVSAYVREQLHAALSQRVDADDLTPTERADVVKNSSRMIDEGTEPDPADFALFEPMASPQGGKLAGLRFVFAPYQVGPYSDGTQTVEVPADVLLPHVAPAYRSLFVGG